MQSYRFHITVRIQGLTFRNEGQTIYEWSEIKKVLTDRLIELENVNSFGNVDPIQSYFERIANESMDKFLREMDFLYEGHPPRIKKIQISELRYGPGSLVIDFFYSIIATGITYAAIKGAVHEFKIDIKSLLSRLTNGYVDVCVKKRKFKFKIGRSAYRQFKVNKTYVNGAAIIILFAISLWFNSYSSRKSNEEMRLLIKELLQAKQTQSDKNVPIKTDTIP